MIGQRGASDALTYRWQYLNADDDITSDPFCVTHADRMRAWDGAHGDVCIVEVQRTPRGRWQITSTDCAAGIPVSAYDRRFPSPLDALGYIAKRQGRRPVGAVCRCGTPGGECD
ncbi:hypothetical protein [Actinoplanes sp. NPDC049118]|uniref:hypothetical protein n=1 Tax=Actinoplanes sp. NPDC049118 TaxID=3155769 RepID=UPI0033F8673E